MPSTSFISCVSRDRRRRWLPVMATGPAEETPMGSYSESLSESVSRYSPSLNSGDSNRLVSFSGVPLASALLPKNGEVKPRTPTGVTGKPSAPKATGSGPTPSIAESPFTVLLRLPE